MAASYARSLERHEPTFAELFTPKLVDVLREGYGWPQLRADVIVGAGRTVRRVLLRAGLTKPLVRYAAS